MKKHIKALQAAESGERHSIFFACVERVRVQANTEMVSIHSNYCIDLGILGTELLCPWQCNLGLQLKACDTWKS